MREARVGPGGDAPQLLQPHRAGGLAGQDALVVQRKPVAVKQRLGLEMLELTRCLLLTFANAGSLALALLGAHLAGDHAPCVDGAIDLAAAPRRSRER